MKENIKELLEFDAIKETEEFFDEKNTDRTNAFSFGLFLDNNKRKEELLTKMGDTPFNSSLDKYLEVAENNGFEVILVEDFTKEDIYTTRQGDELVKIPYENTSQLFILWNIEKSILLHFDTYPSYRLNDSNEVYLDNIKINGGHFHYNIAFEDIDKGYGTATSSGGFKKVSEENIKEQPILKDIEMVWSGDHDCREALAYNISILNKYGTFLTKWIDIPFFRLMHHSEWKSDRSSTDINADRIRKLPLYIQEIIS